MRLPRLDTIIIGVFFVSIALWMMSKCGSKRSDYLQRAARTDEREDRPVRRDTVYAPTPATTTVPTTAPATPTTTPATTPVTTTPAQVATTPATTPSATPAPRPSATPATTPATTPKTAAPKTAATSSQTTLYVTIDGLKVRQKPGLKSETVAKLDLYEQVYYMGEKTDWTQEISLGVEKVTDRWVKIKTKSGKTGWVFGAGVNYYKEKRKGVLE